MIPVRSELLLPARIPRLGVGAANVATDDPRGLPQFSERPLNIGNFESAVLPICRCVIGAQTIQVDCNVNVLVAQIRCELFELVTPILAQDRARTLSIFDRPIVGPRMNFEPAGALRAAIRENVVRPPTFEISAAPNRDVLDMRQLERAIDPTAARPFRRRDRPVRMIIERNKNEGLVASSQPKRAQVMEVARTIECEWRKPCTQFAIKFFNDPFRRAEAKLRTPLASIERRQLRRRISPRVVEI